MQAIPSGSCILCCWKIIGVLFSITPIFTLHGIWTNFPAGMTMLLALIFTVVPESSSATGNVPTNALSFSSSSMSMAYWNILINKYSGCDSTMTLTTLKPTIGCSKWSVATRNGTSFLLPTLPSPICNWSIVKPANGISELFSHCTLNESCPSKISEIALISALIKFSSKYF